ncbi:MAG: ABC transporter substrate-binding protein [Spirochaetales bacterium]
MKKLFLLLFVGLLVGLPAFAGGEQETEPTGDADAMEEDVVTLGIATGSVGTEYELLLDQIERYEAENPNVRIEALDTPDLATDRLGLYLQFFEAQSPELDIYMIDVIWPGDLAEHLVDLYEYGAEEQVDEHFPAIVENNTVDGKLVGMPWFTDAGLLYYRTDLLEEYGYDEPPADWGELTEMATTIQEGEREAGNEDFWGYVWQGNAYEGLTCDALEWIYSNDGGTIVSPDGVITINNDRAVEALELAASWVGTISPPGVTGFAEEDARNMWQAGNAAFMRNWPYAYNLGNEEDSAIAGQFDVAPLPAGRSGSGAATLGGWQLGVSKYSEHPQEAVDFLLWLTGYEEQLYKAIEGSNNPTYMAVYDSSEIEEEVPFMVSLYDVFTNAVARPSTVTAPQYNETSVLFFTAVHNVLTGDLDAETALEELELDLVDLLDMPTGDPQ